MDFGSLGLDLETLISASDSKPNEPPNKPYRSGLLIKQERSVSVNSLEGDYRSPKIQKIDDLNTMSSQQQTSSSSSSSSLLRSNRHQRQQQQMLSFSSSPKSDSLTKDVLLYSRTSQQTSTFPYYRNAVSGFGSGSSNSSTNVAFAGVRGQFTPSQWVELEHQALILKYITANVPIPTNLLIPIRKAVNSSGLCGLSSGSLPPHSCKLLSLQERSLFFEASNLDLNVLKGGSVDSSSIRFMVFTSYLILVVLCVGYAYFFVVGWGSCHLGFAGNTDPEPGRCRRTDGKKWRCSRDAVPDQKYCERHINRGRHRSRKPVEGQIGRAISGPTNSKVVVPMASSMSSTVLSSGGASKSLALSQHQFNFKALQTGAPNSNSTDALVSSVMLRKKNVSDRTQDPQGLSIMSPTINLKSRDISFSTLKQQIPYEEFSQTEFGLLSLDSFLNSSQRSPLTTCRNYTSCTDFSEQENQDQHSLCHYIDDWPKDQSTRSVITWPDELKSDWTQLSMSMPMTVSDFSSSSSSSMHENLTLSPLRSSEFDPIQMGLGVNSLIEPNQKQSSWIPKSWGTSLGGPLGEALTNTTSNGGACKNPSGLNLLNEGWDGSPQLGSSPTGVLQKGTFGSLSNGSTGSSPRDETKKIQDAGSLYNDVLGSTLASSSVPSS
ncbi:WRC domain [Dillenia turbinata]|uniref:Growth-regulating factor n=1 Tax=Dillenia turbinata TaxID=194707 RepID=A0AAN8V9P3_9MAGN